MRGEQTQASKQKTQPVKKELFQSFSKNKRYFAGVHLFL